MKPSEGYVVPPSILLLALLGEDARQAALALADLGVPVFPVHHPVGSDRCSCGKLACRSVAKHPRTSRGLLEATTIDLRIMEWWRQWPGANLAIATSRAAGVWVLDADAKSGGLETLRALETEHGALPDTWTVGTGGGGAHRWFAYSGFPIPTRAGDLGDGLDVRGDGGYAIAPPSAHVSGNRYRWEPGLDPGSVPLASAPSWLLDRVRVRAKMVPPVATPLGNGAGGNHPGEHGSVPEGQRNATLTRLGGAMRRQGFGEEAIRAALLAENAARCQPPLTEDEVARVARSLARYAPAPLANHANRRGGGFVEFVGGKAVRR